MGEKWMSTSMLRSKPMALTYATPKPWLHLIRIGVTARTFFHAVISLS